MALRLPSKPKRQNPERRRQYTVRQIPAEIDQALRRKAAAESVSLNTAALSALRAGLGVQASHRDLAGVVGTLDDETRQILENVEEFCDPPIPSGW